MRVDWQLEELLLPDTSHLCSGYLSINAVQSLVKSDMKSLTGLDLTGYVLDGYSVAIMVAPVRQFSILGAAVRAPGPPCGVY